MAPRRRTTAPAAFPTPAELDILAVLWKLSVATVREVHNELGKDQGYTTTLKTMQLMLDKGLLTRTERFGSHVYQSAATQEQTQRQIAGDLLKRAFGGSTRNLLLGALAAQPASAQELDEIRSIIEEAAKGRKGK